MQKEKLIVKNFFTLKDVEIELSKFNIFIGEQASGKSLLIKLVYFFKKISTSPIINYKTELSELNQRYIHLFDEIFNLNNFNLNSEITYYIDNHNITMSIANNKIIITYSHSLTSMYEAQRIILNKRYDESTNNANDTDIVKYSIMDIAVLNAVENSKLGKVNLTRFLPAGRMSLLILLNNLFNMIDNKNINLPILLTMFGQQYQSAIATFNGKIRTDTTDKLPEFEEYASKILKSKYVHDLMGGYLEQNGFNTRISDSSSGQQEFLPIYMILRHYLLSGYTDGELYIEEPEAHLYPTAQKDIVELLTYVTNITNSAGLYITTHSPYILTVLNNLIMAHDVKDKQPNTNPNILINFDDVRAYFIGNGTATSLMDQEYRIIDAEKLDEVSNTINAQYSEMVDLL
ncbi:MAG: AAA family ATPase [Proteobacteria bacterium]|jgi:ABC-type lipoprotein export system ATPase subunit|nr:AAA family ATPase [Pseudomonadota bacterium]